MTKDQQFASARKLQQPTAAAATAFEAGQEAMAAELNRRMLARPDLDRLIGSDNRAMMENNSRNFMRFMASLLQGYEPTVLVETALWVFRAYRSHGFHTSYWPANLDTAVQIIKEELTPDVFGEVYPFFDWLIVNIPAFVLLSDEALEAGTSHGHDF
ncbi:MAG: hypothetical protein WCK47_14645 [bacterium]|nr:hypothetical protein [Candidatus Sumerlaeota bacterium]